MQESKLSAICERVFDRCLAPSAGGEGCDNMSMILIQFKNPSGSGAAGEEPHITRTGKSAEETDHSTSKGSSSSQC